MRTIHVSLLALAAVAGVAASPGVAQAQYWRGYGYGYHRWGWERPFAYPYVGFYGYPRIRPYYVAPPEVVFEPPPVIYEEPPVIETAPRRVYRTPVVHRVVRPRPAQPVSCTCPTQPTAASVPPALSGPLTGPLTGPLPALRPAPTNNVYPPENP